MALKRENKQECVEHSQAVTIFDNLLIKKGEKRSDNSGE